MGIAKGNLVIRNGGNLQIAGVARAGVAARGAVVYRRVVVPASKWTLIRSASGPAPTLTMDTTGANVLVSVCTKVGLGGGITGDTYNNTIVTIVAGEAAGSASVILSAYGIAGSSVTTGLTHAFNGSGSQAVFHIAAFTFTGDTSMVIPNSAQTPTTRPGPITPYMPDSLFITTISADGDATSTPTGFTLIQSYPYQSGQRMGSSIAYRLQAGTDPVDPVWTYSGTTVRTTVAALNPF